MTTPVIVADHLSKRYKIGLPGAGDRSFCEAVTDTVLSPFRRLRALRESARADETIWALDGVSFEVAPGEVMGVIGRNGAGKSTLLKILARITEPTSGRALIRGRVGSLLEVGTGFHPELTGRENVYLSGAILGMRRAEIRRKFDQIVAFAEIEKFLDTPVKRYSSGMYVRLAFAVAAHLEPEILLVDEVLAVGDVAFQRKCLGKMDEVARSGRTVLFVSHNMPAVLALCTQAMILESGRLTGIGEPQPIVRRYLDAALQHAEEPLGRRTDRRGSGRARLIAFKMAEHPAGPALGDFLLGDAACFVLTIEADEPMELWSGVQVKDCWGRLISSFHSRESAYSCLVEKGRTNVIIRIPHLPFLEGRYTLDAMIARTGTHELCDKIEAVGSFVMHPKDLCGSGAPLKAQHGIVHVTHEWQADRGESAELCPVDVQTGT